ncbi:AMP-binding protein [Guyparkeria sp. 1SP6A2]|nr:AMP-binding protein [Guyparkeria sp. 1SP6A2]
MSASDRDCRPLPVLMNDRLERIILRSPDRSWTAADLLSSAQVLSKRLRVLGDEPRYLINLANRRDDFLVGLLGGMIGGHTNLMPASQTPGAINDLLVEHPGAVLIHGDEDVMDPGLATRLRRVAIPGLRESAAQHRPGTIPRIAADTVVARVFTSGSTGKPCGHDKTWQRLVWNARAAAQALTQSLDEPAAPTLEPYHVLGTVPSQHMYGFESLILATLCEGAVLSTEQPFFPTDIANALSRLPAPRMLVTTPYHLHHLLAAGIALPRCERVLCATAPLDPALARRAEQLLGGALHEIYGCTETGQIAVRRPSRNRAWSLMPEIALRQHDDETVAHGGHIETPTPLADRIEPVKGRRFHLLGRHTNQVNIAGKRSSIEFLNAKLGAIEGVIDGLFFDPGSGGEHLGSRLAAVVCAPGLSAERIREALRTEVDPVFLPRPLLLVDRLPVNATGKVTRESLLRLIDADPPSARQEVC